MTRHIDAAAAEADAFHLELQPLLQTLRPRQSDRAPGSDDAMPRQALKRI